MTTTRKRHEFDFGTTFANLLAITRRYLELAPHGAAPRCDPMGAPPPRPAPHLVDVDPGFADTVPSMMPGVPPPPGETPRS